VQVLSLQGQPSLHIVFPKPGWVSG